MRLVLLAVSAWLAGAGAAQAGLSLRASPAVSGAVATVGDVFDGAGAKAGLPLARLPADGQGLSFDARALQQRLAAAGLSWANAEGVARVTIAAPARAPAAARETEGDAALTAVPVLGRPIAAGETITLSDLDFLMLAAADLPAGAASDARALVGQTARRALPAGRPVRTADVAPPQAWKRGEPVLLIYAAGGVRLTARGRALADARVGEAARVANVQSDRLVDVVAEGPGEARVHAFPAAQPFRSAAR